MIKKISYLKIGIVLIVAAAAFLTGLLVGVDAGYDTGHKMALIEIKAGAKMRSPGLQIAGAGSEGFYASTP